MENQFRQYPLEEDILGALDALGYTQPTEIQAAVIPSILNGRDIIAKSKTGSGKTAAFAIPILQFCRLGAEYCAGTCLRADKRACLSGEGRTLRYWPF